MEAYGPSAQKLRKSIKNKDYSVVLKHKNIPYIPLFLKWTSKITLSHWGKTHLILRAQALTTCPPRGINDMQMEAPEIFKARAEVVPYQ